MEEKILVILEQMQSQLNENTQILRALDDRTKVLSAEVKAIKEDVNYIKGDLIAQKKDYTTFKENLKKVASE